MATTDAYEDGSQETRQDFTANDFRITRALDSLLTNAKAIKGDEVAAEDILARVQTLRHPLPRSERRQGAPNVGSRAVQVVTEGA